MTSIIPKNIFQTHKSLVYINSKPKILNAVKSWVKHSSKFKYYFYDNNLCDKFILENFDAKIYEAYKKLPLGVMKADLWRYCIIYRYGGIYADTDTICKVNPSIFLTDALLTIVPENSTHLCQWVFSAPKNSPILKSVIDLSVERILNIKEIKGEHIIHFLTGPAVFTDGIEKYLVENNLPIFDDKLKYFKYPESNTLRVFNYHFFHDNIVKHLFSGQDSDGWCKERDNLLIK
jgi:mannosyltransferase OCH1-like enzyme